MNKHKQRNSNDVKQVATTSATAGKWTYYTLVVVMRDGTPEFRRFHSATDVRKLPGHDQEMFLAWAAESIGISVEDTADRGSDPCMKLEAFDTEQEAKAQYDWLLREFGPVVPVEGPLTEKFTDGVTSRGGTG